jgi:predicted membrane-bound spermidine synthase
MEPGLAGSLGGLALFLFPGAAWALALAPRLGWAKGAGLATVLAFTVAPGALFLLNVLFDAPLRLDTAVFLSVALGMAGIATRLAGPLLSSTQD